VSVGFSYRENVISKLERIKINMNRRILFYLLLAVFVYLAGVQIVNALSGRPLFSDINTAYFWSGLVLVIILSIVFNLWPRKSREYAMAVVPFVMLAFGITLIFLSQVESLWTNPPWNPSVFGAGVSVSALGMAFLIAFWPRVSPKTNEISQNDRRHLHNSNPQLSKAQMAKNIHGRHTLQYGLVATLVLLVIFILLQYFFPAVLTLDVKWIAVSVVPLLLALIAGGYVRIIKGFGIELETRIEEPIVSLDLRATDALTLLKGLKKQRIRDLDRLSKDQRKRIARLTFFSGRRGYYDAYVIEQYLYSLPNLEYFEILSSDGTFLCFLPTRLFKIEEEILKDELFQFVTALQNNKTLDLYSANAITFVVKTDQSIIDVLRMLRSYVLDLAVVTDINGTVVGIVKLSDIEKRIADEVLLARKLGKKH